MITRSRTLASLIFLITAHSICSFAGNSIEQLSAENTICDLGHISVKDGPQTCRFNITNNGSDEIEITEAITSCGCTQVRLPEGPIAPEETVSIEVTYDNKEVTEFFDKRIALRFKGIDTPLLLSVKGSTANPERKRFRYTSRFLKFEKEEFKAGDVIQGCAASGELKAIYRRFRPAKIAFSCQEEGIEIKSDTATLRRGDTLTLRYSIVTGTDCFGTKEYRILPCRISGKDRRLDRKGIRITAVSHAEMNPEEDGARRPELNTGWKHTNLGVLRRGKVRTVEIPVTNSGDADLVIHRIDCKGITPACCRTVIRPGESETLTLNFKPQTRRKGRYAETMTLYSNDKVNPECALYLTYEIKATPFFHYTTPQGKTQF